MSFKTQIFSQVFWRTWDKTGCLDWNMAIMAVVGSTPLSSARNTQVDFLLITTQNIPHFPTHTCAKSKESKAENDAYLLQPKPPQKNLMLHVVRQSSGQRWLCSPHWIVLGWRRGAYTCRYSSSYSSRINLHLLLSVLLRQFLNTSNVLSFHLYFLKVSLTTCDSWEIVINNVIKTRLVVSRKKRF